MIKMWKVYIVENNEETLIYRAGWMPTIDNMELVYKVRGKQYKVVSPAGKDVTQLFPYGTPT